MGMVMAKILGFHLDKDTCNTLSDDAEQIFEAITDKYSGQFNLKYSTSNQLSASQPELDLEEKSEICIRTIATELIGRSTCILWVYCNGNKLLTIIMNNYTSLKYKYIFISIIIY